MLKYIISEKIINDTDESFKFNAGSKARIDAEKIFLKNGYMGLDFINKSKVRTKLEKLKYYMSLTKELKNIVKIVSKNDIIVFQYPMLIFSFGLKNIIKKLNKKGATTVALIHDINSLRENKKTLKHFYLNKISNGILRQFKFIISHNQSMTEYLKSQAKCKHSVIENLNLFDYLYNGPSAKITNKKNIVFAGNLKKSPFLKKINQLGDINFNLYGLGYDDEMAGQNVNYKGVFHPDKLIENLEGGFGLVWDGFDISYCSGEKGNYLKYNNPHKTSLYLTAGLPVIVWNKSAIKDFVKKNKIGFGVDSLFELNQKIEQMSNEEYNEMLDNVRELSSKLSVGKFLENNILEIENHKGTN